MMTRQEAEAIYDAGKETVVRVLCELSLTVDQLKAEFATLKTENVALRAECQVLREEVQLLKEQIAKDSRYYPRGMEFTLSATAHGLAALAA